MREFKQCVEREKIVFNVEVKDPTAPVDFFINGEQVIPDGERVEVVNLGDGKHQLILNKVRLRATSQLQVLFVLICAALSIIYLYT